MLHVIYNMKYNQQKIKHFTKQKHKIKEKEIKKCAKTMYQIFLNNTLIWMTEQYTLSS